MNYIINIAKECILADQANPKDNAIRTPRHEIRTKTDKKKPNK